MKRPTLFLSAGEVSGDLHGAYLAHALTAACPGCRLVGLGGPRMAAAGVEILHDITAHSAVGLTEQIPHALPVLKAFGAAKTALAHIKPDAVVLIDFQGANLNLAKRARKLGIKTIYYIAPQDWLWGIGNGIKRVAAGVDLFLAVFEPEAAAYKAAGARVAYVGHPLLDILPSPPPAPLDARISLGLAPTGQVLALLPGSRAQEVKTLLPIFLETARQLRSDRPDIQFVLPIASGALEEAITTLVNNSELPIHLFNGRSQEALLVADAALTASGTAVLEAAILAVPCVAAYKVSALTGWLARRLLRVRHVTLPNILAQRDVVPEFLQGNATPSALTKSLQALLSPGATRAAQLEGLASVKALLGAPGALERAAGLILTEAGWLDPETRFAISHFPNQTPCAP
jgi:lipid-A-disaccharide synthase